MKHLIISFGLILMSIGLIAQEINLNNPLPVNEKIKKATLKNGMTYYLYKTDVTKNVASYYIIQNVGSILENEDQLGLAHFLEHMAFNGTKHFKGKGLIHFLERHGVKFGSHINAYTGFDETVYNLDNLPTNKPGLIDSSLLVLHDWSNYLSLIDEEIDAERGVIKEEWRTRRNGQMRLMEKALPVMFNNSKYSKRLPIGTMEVVENFDPKILRDFYHDWYRTDLQAIAVVGDFDMEEMEQKIIKRFSSIPAIENPRERVLSTIPGNDEMLFHLGMDEEVSTSNISFTIRHESSLKEETVKDLKEALLNYMVTGMLSTRFYELSQKPEAPFVGVRVGYQSMVRTCKIFAAGIYPKPDKQYEAFESFMNELNRAVKYGFTQAEIDRTIAQFKSFYENQISKIDDLAHKDIVETIKSNYLENATMADITKEYELVKKIFEKLTPKEVHARLKALYSKKNRTLNVTGVKGRKNLTKEDAFQIIKKAEGGNELVAYTDNFSGKTLISGLKIKPGKIAKEEKNEIIGSTVFTLSNGVKVHYKFADKDKNEVKLDAISYGGLSLLKDEDLPSASIAGNLVAMSGLGDYSATDLPKILAGKTANAKIGIGEFMEKVEASSVTKDVETMLQMVYLRFVKPRFDEDSYKVLMQNIDNYLIRKSKDLKALMQDSLVVSVYGNNNLKKHIFDKAYIEKMSFDKAKAIYLERFKNIADFEFFIVGDVKAEDLKPLLEKYIASIPANSAKENWKDNSSAWVQNQIDKDIYLKMEVPKGSVRIVYKNDMKYNLKNVYLAKALGDILSLRYLESIREKEGGTYGVGVNAYLSKRPKPQVIVSISFDGNPDAIDKLVAIVHKEINKLKDGNVKQDDLDKTLANYQKEREDFKNYNAYDMALLKNYVLEGYNMNESKNFEDIVNSISTKDIQKLTKKLLNNPKTYEIIFKPKKD